MDFKFELITEKDYETAVADLKKSVAANSFGVLWELNFKDKMKEKNIPFDRNFKVMEVCNPMKAKEVMEAELSAGYLLPCKMVVYEAEDGTVRMGMLRPNVLVGLVDNPEVAGFAQEVEATLKKALEEAQ